MVKYLVKNTCASQKMDCLRFGLGRSLAASQLRDVAVVPLQAHLIEESGPIQRGVYKISAFAKDSF